VAARGRAIVALSGGSTPKKMGELLARPEFASRVPWGETDLFWGDERWVPLASSESNAGEARRAFLDAVPAPPERIHPVATDLASPVRAAEAYEAEIRRVAGTVEGIPVFDLVLLGMGDDGHTASLFPGTAALHERDRLVVENFVPKLGVDRITFTYRCWPPPARCSSSSAAPARPTRWPGCWRDRPSPRGCRPKASGSRTAR
jgi:6-phosphogluconolactonase